MTNNNRIDFDFVKVNWKPKLLGTFAFAMIVAIIGLIVPGHELEYICYMTVFYCGMLSFIYVLPSAMVLILIHAKTSLLNRPSLIQYQPLYLWVCQTAVKWSLYAIFSTIWLVALAWLLILLNLKTPG